MKPAAFDYLRAGTVEEALAALAEHGDEARVMAGGQSLMPMLSMRMVRPELVIDIGRIAALDRIEADAGALVVGAAVTQARLLDHLGRKDGSALLARALPWVGHVQTRSRGTVCGSLAHGDPSAELPLCLAALGGTVELRSARGTRSVAAADFFEAALVTACGPEEMVTAARFPDPGPAAGVAFREVAYRHGDFAVAAFAAIAREGGIRFAVGGVADRPLAVDWPVLDGDALADAIEALVADLDPADDPLASAAYRRRLVRRVGRATIEAALEARS